MSPASSSTAIITPIAAPNPNSSGGRRFPPPCWTDDETLALIDSYKNKWYSLNRSNLRAAHWDDVAAAVSARCSAATPKKTSVQCRHKIEKLRKRYRSALPSSPWIFFHHMDHLENPNPNPNPIHDSDHLYQRRLVIPRAARSSRVGIPSPNPSFANPGFEEMRRRIEAKRRREEEEVGAMGEMVRALGSLGDGYMRMEQMKMEMAREMERARMEMELKRTEMILDTQRKMVDLFVKGFVGEKKVKR